LLLALVLAVASWSALALLVQTTYPDNLTKLVFLALLGVALVGTAWPVLLAINQRRNPHVAPIRIWRQSGWVALFGILLAWLQMKPNRALTLSIAITIGGIFALIELLLILREHKDTPDGK
jgi:hypothetical protein